LLQTILCELNHSYRQQDEQELRLELSPAIRALRPQREALVLICDEAHQLSEELLEELRILSDLAEHGRPLVRLVLVGQLGLEETLALSSLEALSQRIRAHVCLETLNRVGSLDYIDYRLTWAGGRTDEIFTAEALELVSRAADGVPRCLNQLCDHALLLAYVAEQQPVPAELIREALQDLRQLPLHWNESSLTEPARREAASFETDPEFEDHTPEVGPFDDGRSTEPASFEMESIEIGADLPQAGHSRVETIIEQSNSEAEAASSIIETRTESIESSDADEPREVTDIPHEGLRGETMIETPSCWEFGAANSAIVNAGPMSCAPQRSPLSGGFIEELVVDRYAAIDAGLEPTELIAPDTATSQEVHSTATFESQETVEPLSMSSEIDPIEIAEVSALESPTTEMATSEPSDLRLNADFDEVCERLDELLPQVEDDAGWDSASLHAENTTFETNDSTATPVMEAANRIVESRSMEDELGNEVCQLVEQLHELLGQPRRENSPVEQLRSLLSPSAEEEFTGTGGVELDADSGVESSSTSAVETSETTIEPAPSVRGAARPYRNLFSMLRRKQQGLL
ncbi:MAG: AAA family ATPase, partial [Candidatus Saccharimonas sp.]|nr:AAA family ATPase [Planctomycetaceae bacterium]